MKFKTTIKLVTDAKDKNEAVEIAGEYLSGNLTSGVDMKFRTVSIRSHRQILAGTAMVVLVVGVFAIRLHETKHIQPFIQNLPGDSVLQSPLKTSGPDLKSSEFKRLWKSKSAEELLNSIRM